MACAHGPLAHFSATYFNEWPPALSLYYVAVNSVPSKELYLLALFYTEPSVTHSKTCGFLAHPVLNKFLLHKVVYFLCLYFNSVPFHVDKVRRSFSHF